MTDRNTTIEVADSDSLPSILGKISNNSGSIRLIIPLGSSLFFTASEFQALKTVGEADGRTLTVASDDPLRQHLASMFDLPYIGERDGIETEEAPSPALATTPEQSSNESTTEAPSTAPPPVPPSETTRVIPTSDYPDESRTFTLPPPREDLGRRSRNRKKIFGVAGAALAALVVIGLAAAFFLVPRATIAVHLKETPLDSAIVFGISTDESPQTGSEITLTGGSVEADVTVESSAKATGQKQIPDKTAGGKVVFSNPTTKEVTIDKSTKLTGDAGAVFVVAEQVKVPAGKGAQGGPGFADGKVTSSVPGTQGNLGQGELSGKLDSGV